MAAGTFRTDRNNNPIAFTTDIAHQAHLLEGLDFTKGESFVTEGHTYYTAKLLHDPVSLCLHVIDEIGFYTSTGIQRWAYIGIPWFLWKKIERTDKIQVIKFMYDHEGGIGLDGLFN